MIDSITIVKRNEERYPSLLAEIHDPPERLFVRGVIPTEGIFFAVVGTRRPSHYGKEITPKIVEPLAAHGFVIISGLAYGIDALAHEAALAQGGTTVAVLGTGVDEPSLYPRTHRKLARRIIEGGGAILSEYPPGTAGKPHHFPARNRIIAGMARGVLVIEAREKSGALITARLALNENRDVFALPGPITAQTSDGPNRLIQQGAKPILDARDILEEYGIECKATERIQEDLSDEERRILDALAGNGVHVDALGHLLNLSSAELSAILTELELRGKVRHLGGGWYSTR
jgi:DNA processing protein